MYQPNMAVVDLMDSLCYADDSLDPLSLERLEVVGYRLSYQSSQNYYLVLYQKQIKMLWKQLSRLFTVFKSTPGHYLNILP